MRSRRWATWVVVVVGLAACQPHKPSLVPPASVASGPSARPLAVLDAWTAQTWFLRGGRVIDGRGEPPRDADVWIEGGRIVAVDADLPTPPGACVVELEGRFVLPGFIDSHVHLSHEPAASYAEHIRRDVQESDADRALRAAANAAQTLAAGFTTVRNVGGSAVDRALRDAIERGSVLGPRMLVANAEIGITGGHCDDANGMQVDLVDPTLAYQSGVADGPLEVRKAVRYQIQQGADLIKVCVTGGVLSRGDGAVTSQMTADELEAAVDEARRAGRRVAAHAHGTEGIRDAVRAGVTSIEHGSQLDADTIALMKARGTVLVPTLYVASFVEDQARAGTLAPLAARKAIEIAPQIRESFRLAYRSGVAIAFGSDAGVFLHGNNAREFAALVEQGMTPMDAIVAATQSAADLLGLRDVGVLEAHAMADLVVVEGDPLQDISELERPVLVMKEGVVHRMPAWAKTCDDAPLPSSPRLNRPQVPSL